MNEPFELFLRARDGDEEALRIIVEGNLGLVRKIVGRYRPDDLPHHLEPDDLMQDGVEALLKAIAKWDPAKSKFSTYAYLWVSGTIYNRLLESGPVRIPRHLEQKRRHLYNGKEVELSGYEAKLLNRLPTRFISLSSLVGPDADETIEEVTGLEDAKYSQIEYKLDLTQAIQTLPESLQFIATSFRHGLLTAQIAEKMGVTVSYVSILRRQVESRLRGMYAS